MRTRDALSCAEVVELVTDYLEGALAPDAAARVAAHLADCPACGIYIDQMRITSDALHGLEPGGGLPDEACVALVHAFRDWTRR